jgi:hypothetical protein
VCPRDGRNKQIKDRIKKQSKVKYIKKNTVKLKSVQKEENDRGRSKAWKREKGKEKSKS